MPELPTTNCIRELRATQGAMTQIELPKNLGVTRQTVNAIELGKYPPLTGSRLQDCRCIRTAARRSIAIQAIKPGIKKG